jgi:phosphoglucosamine mutase
MRFGTDGIRARCEVLKPALLFSLASALVSQLGEKRGRVLIGEDTRFSSSSISLNFAATLTTLGYDVLYGAVMPSGAISLLTKHYDCLFGVAVTASHNQYQYNGLKFFDGTGSKIDRAHEIEIERLLQSSSFEEGSRFASFTLLERERWNRDYLALLLEIIDREELPSPKKLTLDLANGAYCAVDFKSHLATLKQLTLYNALPDGRNINTGDGRRRATRGISYHYDGDGDRCHCHYDNRDLEGDKLFLPLMLRELARGRRGIVSNYLTNNGVIEAMRGLGATVIVVDKVGDTHIQREMRASGVALGGEASGHMLFGDHANASDALLTTLILDAALRDKETLAYMLKLELWPSYELSLHYEERRKREMEIKKEKLSQLLEKRGEVKGIVRFSGTEPILRVHIECRVLQELESVKGEVERCLR